MKRRSFVASLAALIAAPKALLALKPKPYTATEALADIDAAKVAYPWPTMQRPAQWFDAEGGIDAERGIWRDLSGNGNDLHLGTHQGVHAIYTVPEVLNERQLESVTAQIARKYGIRL
jgi:hypothetical protein